MKTGLIVINYNDYENTIKFVNSISNYKIIDKIVIVDNNSTDNSYELLNKINNNKIQLIKSDINGGYASGINIGSKYLINEFGECNIIVSNTDIIDITEEKIEKLVLDLDKVSLVAPIIKEHTGLNKGWKNPTPKMEVLLNLPIIHRKIRKKHLLYSDDYYNNELVKVDVVSGCLFLIKSSILKKINFMDENTFLYYEENILSKKIKSINENEYIDTTVTLFHNHSITIDKSINRIKKFKILKKSQLYFNKNYNNATTCDIILLNLTSKIMLIILYIAVIFRGGFKK